MARFEIPTTTPLREPPDDYCPEGAERWFELTSGPDAGRTLFYIDHSTGPDPQRTVLLVHGNPECSYTWRHVAESLASSGEPVRIVIPDHLGFGLSDQASFEMVDMHHAANLAQLVEHLDLREISLVIHDWGGPIGTGAFLDQPDRVSSLTVVNTTIFPMPASGLTYTNFPFPWLAWSWTPNLIPWQLWGGVAAYVVPQAEPQGTARFLAGMTGALVRYARRDFPAGSAEAVFSEQFRTRANALASKRHVRQTPVWGHGYRYGDSVQGEIDNSRFYWRLQSELPHAWEEIPTAGLFGTWDACGKPEVVDQWVAAFPGMRVQTFERNGHFLEEHRGPEIAAATLALRD